ALIGAFSLLRRHRRNAAVISHPQSRTLPAGITKKVMAVLPRHSYHANGKPMEPMNIVVLGEKRAVRQVFAAAGWYEALPVSFWNLLRAQLALVFNASFARGPVTPLYVGL